LWCSTLRESITKYRNIIIDILQIQEALCGFQLDEVIINLNGEFYADHRIIVGQLDPNKGDDED
jgi:hypothetical protein